jgi:hypothetical protein
MKRKPPEEPTGAEEGSAVPHSIRPGDVLAGRYRLMDLLAESKGGRFWRAHDRVLERHVALHVISADDPRAPLLLDAARRSATVHDRRLLRVLDADQSGGICYVVNEWGSGDSLDIMLANEGPLGARRAAWLVSEVGSSIAAGHDAGVAHGRLVPENVLVDHAGAVRVIGFAVDAALHGLQPGRLSADVTDLGGLLYAALTGKWPTSSPSDVPRAPAEQGHVLRPRQVRAGIPRPLDSLCDEVLNPYAGHRGARLREAHDLATAHGIADYLIEFVGDPTGLAAAEAAAGHRDTETIVLPALADPPAPPEDEPGTVAAPEAEPEPAPEPTVEVGPEPTTVPVEEPLEQPAEEPAEEPREQPADQPAEQPPGPPAELPTEAGLPIFDDDNDDVSWLSARSDPVPPPPPFEEPPERPLFAPDPPGGRPPRPAPAPVRHSAEYWPWDAGTGTGTGTGLTAAVEDEQEVPGRSWLRLAALLAVCLLLLVAVVVAYNLGRGRTPLGAVPEDDTSTSASPTATASPTPITGLKASDLDPQGDPPFDENPELTGLAVDGDPGTAWRTNTYLQNFGPGGLKTGLGLVIDLGARHEVASVDLTFVGAPTSY